MTDGPQAPRRRTRGAVLVYAILFALIGTGVAVAVLRFVLPLERVEDERAGLAYELPRGWEEIPSYDRWDMYSSGADAGSHGAVAFTFSQPVAPSQDPAVLAELLAEDHTLLMRPEAVDFELLRSESVRLGAFEAHEVELTATDPVHGPVYGRMIIVVSGEAAFTGLYGFSNDPSGTGHDELLELFASLETL
ncbi:hypothetical protein AB0B28_01905 [Glycomyces sp. NPDC046736]|uniref:hypothetical protein n=1 Tax=Glycomyces sp. NPDC046736 TaxID=3155615 RepID=UPI0033DACBEA